MSQMDDILENATASNASFSVAEVVPQEQPTPEVVSDETNIYNDANEEIIALKAKVETLESYISNQFKQTTTEPQEVADWEEYLNSENSMTSRILRDYGIN